MNKNNNSENTTKTNINWYPGHMVKTKKQIMEDLALVDAVAEILDARMPLSSRNPDISQWTKNKKKIIVLNKSDLSDVVENKKWVEYFEKNGVPCVLVEATNGKGIEQFLKIVQKVTEEDRQKAIAKGRIGKSTRIMVVRYT